jgi:hypothetical protein
MNALINRSPIGPARSILLIGIVALASIACTAATEAGAPSPPPVSVAPSVVPSASPTGFHLALKDEYDSGATVDIVDLSGTDATRPRPDRSARTAARLPGMFELPH